MLVVGCVVVVVGGSGAAFSRERVRGNETTHTNV